jgi:hypothetical protein
VEVRIQRHHNTILLRRAKKNRGVRGRGKTTLGSVQDIMAFVAKEPAGRTGYALIE